MEIQRLAFPSFLLPTVLFKLTLITLFFDLVYHLASEPSVAKSFAVLLAAAVLAASLSSKVREACGRLTDALVDPSTARRQPSATEPRSKWIGFGLLSLGLLFLEWRVPKFFLHNDNYTQFLPVMVKSARDFFSGHFPTWNAMQLMGQPTLFSTTYALTNPLTYVAYALASALGRPTLTMDMFCLLHIVLGFLLAERTFRKITGADAWLSVSGALGFVLSGFVLLCGQGWYYMVPIVIWLPIGTVTLHYFLSNPNLRAALALGVSFGCFFYAGNVQMWTYGLVAAALYVAIFLGTGKGTLHHVKMGLLASLLCLILILPLLIDASSFLSDVDRFLWGEGILHRIAGLFLPYPFVDPSGNLWGDQRQMYFSGALLAYSATLAFLLGMKSWLHSSDETRPSRSPGLHICFVLLVLLCIALGTGGTVGGLVYRLPVFNRFSHPFKILGLLNWILLGLGIWSASVLITDRPAAARRKSILFFGGTVALLAWHLACIIPARTYPSGEPYPALASRLARALESTARLATWNPGEVQEKFGSMQANLGTYYGVPELYGYDPIAANKPESYIDPSPRLWAELGADKLLASKTSWNLTKLRETGFTNPLVTQYEDDEFLLFEIKGAKPLVLLPAGGEVLNLQTLGDGIEFKTKSPFLNSNALVNFLFRKDMHAFVDGKRIDLGRDALGRIEMTIPPGEHAIRLRYGSWQIVGYLLVAFQFVSLIWLVASIFSTRPRLRTVIQPLL